MPLKTAAIFLTLLLTGCRFNYAPADCAAGGYKVDIAGDKTSYRLWPPDTVRITAVNRSACNIFYQSPGFFATLQRLEKGRWIDLGPWYGIIAIAPRTVNSTPGGCIPVPYLTTDWDFMQKPGTYAVYLKLYEDEALKHALPQRACRSKAFEIVERNTFNKR